MKGNFKRKIIGFISVFLVCLVASQSPAAEFAGGTGEPDNPYQIATAQQLISIGDDPNLLDKHYVLVNDIDLDPNLPGGQVFTKAVIASYEWTQYGNIPGRTRFSGSLDGNSYSISNMVIKGDTGDESENFGLIGYLYVNGIVKNIQLRNIKILNVGSQAGALVGLNYGTVLRCSATGSISGEAHVGGLVGDNYGDIVYCSASCNVQSVPGGAVRGAGGLAGLNSGYISNCYAIGTVTGGDFLGGLVGVNHSYIFNCYSMSTVTGEEILGGLVGNNFGYISNCYALGTVTGEQTLGGLVGANENSIHAVVSQCYAACEIITAPKDSIGGLIGKSYARSTNTNSFWDVQVSGQRISAGGTGLNTAELQNSETYLNDGWNMAGGTSHGLTDIWMIAEPNTYPQLIRLTDQYITTQLSGSGTPDDPYEIATAADLLAINDYDINTNYVLVADIDMSGMVWATAPIFFFIGTLNGQGHTISNLTIDGGNYLGLFGRIGSNGRVTNIFLKDFSIKGSDTIGGLAGSNRGIILNCYATGNVLGGSNSDNLGGLVGGNRGIILGCSISGNVSGGTESGSLGGLVGSCYYGIIKDCHAEIHVSGGGRWWSYNFGGLVGYTEGGTITNCYAVGSISGEGMISGLGGLVGCNEYGGKIDNCYANTEITGGQDSRSIGGLVGTNNGATIIDCYATGNATGAGLMGGLVGNAPSRSIIKNCYSTVRKYFYTGEISDYGGLILAIDNPLDVSQCFWGIEDTGASKSTGGTGLSTAQMQDIQTYLDAGWDMVGERENGTADIWRMPEGGGYPELAVFSDDYQPHIFVGSGSPEDPYQIADAEDLGAIRRYDSSACYKLVADVNLSGISWDTSPIPEFDGSFDGNSHCIMNLTINSNIPEDIGLFGNIGNDGQIWNLGLENVSITRTDSSRGLGGLAGNSSGDINNCYVNGKISSGNDSVWLGLLVGANGGNITNCYTKGSISFGNDSGAIGGLAGANFFNSIVNCYSATSFSHSDESSWNIGGLLGLNQDGTIADCYFLTESEGGGPDNGLGLPLTDGQMKQQDSFVGWDFDEIWMICEGIDYPRLQWQDILCGE